MSTQMSLIVIVLVLLAHGIGHTMGLFPAFGWASSQGWSSESWLLTPLIGELPARWIGVIIWVAGLLSFVALALGTVGVVIPSSWCRPLGIFAAVISLIGLALFWNAFPQLFNKVGCIMVDAIVLYAFVVRNGQLIDLIRG